MNENLYSFELGNDILDDLLYANTKSGSQLTERHGRMNTFDIEDAKAETPKDKLLNLTHIPFMKREEIPNVRENNKEFWECVRRFRDIGSFLRFRGSK